MLPVLVLCQLGLHALFAALAPAGHAAVSHEHAHHASPSPWWTEELAPRMLVAHLLCAVLTAVVWWVRRAVVAVVLGLARPLPGVSWRQARAARAVSSLGAARVWLVGDPGRAPPRVLAPA